MGSKVIAGPSNSVVIDRQGMYFMAGKVRHALQLLCLKTQFRIVQEYWRWFAPRSHEHCWMLTRFVGSGGQPFSTFKVIQDIMYEHSKPIMQTLTDRNQL